MNALILIFTILFFAHTSKSAEAGCSGNGDCQCLDVSYSGCREGVTREKMHVGNLEECIFQCDVSGYLC